jgi:hypothetical protein
METSASMIRYLLQILALVLFAGPPVSYLKYQRPVQTSSASGQYYVPVDETTWTHARPDLGDLRIFADQTEVPYALVTKRGSLEQDHRDVRVFQQSTLNGKTQFFLDMSGLAEYNHVDLKLGSKDFVAHAHVEGQDDLHAPYWASLGDSILYDLSKEKLGSNSMLRLPRAAYHYLRVTIEGPVKPQDILGAVSETQEEQQAVWRDVSASPQQTQQGKDTVLTFQVPENVPLEKLSFEIDPAQPNFRRNIEIKSGAGSVIGSGEINRIHMVRAGQEIDSDDHDVDFSEIGQQNLSIVIHNGDDPPLRITGARLRQLERRVYFDPPPSAQLVLYYGDEKLGRPVYDYAKLFQENKNAKPARLGAEAANAAYTGRPDNRPWSERHPVVLWAAIIGAVLVLGAIALRSMRSASA